MSSRKGLGKGLGALISGNEDLTDISDEKRLGVIEVDINKIEPNANQPRQYFDTAALDELAQSIIQYGILQPLLVKKEDGFYSIIAGERRWRASRLAGLTTVPVIVKDYTELERLQVALIENLQRTDLNLIEEAYCYKRLSEEFSLTQEEIAENVNKNRSYISNSIRLLSLDKRVQGFLSENKISMGHAKVLLGIKSNEAQFEISEQIIEDELSVRQTEVLVKQYIDNEKKIAEETKPKQLKENQYQYVADELKNLFGSKVNIVDGKNKGKIEIEYYSPDELDRLISLFKSKII